VPEELWVLATEMGKRYGVSRAARALGVHYYGLKKRVEEEKGEAPDPADGNADAAATGMPAGRSWRSAPDSADGNGDAAGRPAFVEIRTVPDSASSGCVVEFEGVAGTMRVRFDDVKPAVLVELTRAVLERRA